MEVFPGNVKPPRDKRRKVFQDMLIMSEGGIGKRTGLHLFPVQNRAGKGVKAAALSSKTGNLACATMVDQSIDRIVLTSSKGQVIKLPIKNVPQMGRITQGVIMMRFTKKGDYVTGVTTLEKNENVQEDKKASKSSKKG